MSLSSTMARGVLGDPSAQARGRRTAGFERKERRQDSMRDVPLRKWRSHRKALNDMKDSLRELRAEWRSTDPGPEKDRLKQRWKDGFDEYETTKAQLQQMRNVYQQQWEKAVEEMNDPTSDVSRSKKRRFDRRDKYITGSELYSELRRTSIKLNQWEPGLGAPKFTHIVQNIKEGETVGDTEQYTIDSSTESTNAVSLDQMPIMLAPQEYKFYQQSYAQTDADIDPSGNIIMAEQQGGGQTEFEDRRKVVQGAVPGVQVNTTVQEPPKAVDAYNKIFEEGGAATTKYKFDINGDPIE